MPFGMLPALKVRGVSGMVANLHAAEKQAVEAVKASVRRMGEEQRSRTEQECPKRTGFMASKTRLDFSPEGLTYNVGYEAADFEGGGMAFYPQFVIFGTRYMAPNNFIFRVQEEMAPRLTREVGQAVKDAYGEVLR